MGKGYMRISEAANALGITRQALYERIRKNTDDILDHIVYREVSAGRGPKNKMFYISADYIEEILRSQDEVDSETMIDFINAYYDLWGCIERELEDEGFISRDPSSKKFSKRDLDYIEEVIVSGAIRSGDFTQTEEEVVVRMLSDMDLVSESLCKKATKVIGALLDSCRERKKEREIRVVVDAGTPEEQEGSLGVEA